MIRQPTNKRTSPWYMVKVTTEFGPYTKSKSHFCAATSYKNNIHEYVVIQEFKASNNCILRYDGKVLAQGSTNAKSLKTIYFDLGIVSMKQYIRSSRLQCMSKVTAMAHLKYISDTPIDEDHWLVAKLEECVYNKYRDLITIRDLTE